MSKVRKIADYQIVFNQFEQTLQFLRRLLINTILKIIACNHKYFFFMKCIRII
jgi:hypothetical protein